MVTVYILTLKDGAVRSSVLRTTLCGAAAAAALQHQLLLVGLVGYEVIDCFDNYTRVRPAPPRKLVRLVGIPTHQLGRKTVELGVGAGLREVVLGGVSQTISNSYSKLFFPVH